MRLLLTIWLFFIVAVISAQSGAVVSSQNKPGDADSAAHFKNELTIYVIPALVKYDWTSPQTLLKSYFRNYKRNLFKKEKYLLGHAFVELRSPLASGRILTGMSAVSRKEQKDLAYNQHYGLAMLGADIEGTLETGSDLEPTLEKYSRIGRLAFMTFFISDEATERLLLFYKSFKEAIDSNNVRGARYSGAFWPRYYGEGSGCSAFAVSFLDIAGLLREEFEGWKLKIDIPMELIGGPYNNNNHVKLSDIKKCDSWAGNNETDTVIYEHLEIYDPTLMYEWTQKMYERQDTLDVMTAIPAQLKKARGIRMDGRQVPVPEEESIFMDRKQPSIFIDYYNKKY